MTNKNKKINKRIYCAILALSFCISLFCSCSNNKAAAKIVSADEDGTITIMASDGSEYKVKPVEETSEEEEKHETIINVNALGAYGDGEHDDTDVIKNAAAGMTEGVLYFPVGTYRVTKKIEIGASGITVRGDGAGSVIIYDPASADSGDALFGFADGVSGIKLCDISLIFADGNNNAPNACGAVFDRCDNVIIDSVTFSGFPKSGLDISTGAKNPSKSVAVTDCIIKNCSFCGINVGSADGVDISGCRIYANGVKKKASCGYGIYSSDAVSPVNVRIMNNIIDENTLSGVYMLSGSKVIVTGNMLKSNGVSGIYTVGKKLSFVTVSNNTVRDIPGSDKTVYDGELFCGIAAGSTESTVSLNQISVMNNIVKSVSGTYGYAVFTSKNDAVVFTDNTAELDRAENVLYVEDVSGSDPAARLTISSNTFYAFQVSSDGIAVKNFKSINLYDNRLAFNNVMNGSCVGITSPKSTVLIAARNVFTESSGKAKGIKFENADTEKIVLENNFMNAKEISEIN